MTLEIIYIISKGDENRGMIIIKEFDDCLSVVNSDNGEEILFVDVWDSTICDILKDSNRFNREYYIVESLSMVVLTKDDKPVQKCRTFKRSCFIRKNI